MLQYLLGFVKNIFKFSVIYFRKFTASIIEISWIFSFQIIYAMPPENIHIMIIFLFFFFFCLVLLLFHNLLVFRLEVLLNCKPVPNWNEKLPSFPFIQCSTHFWYFFAANHKSFFGMLPKISLRQAFFSCFWSFKLFAVLNEFFVLGFSFSFYNMCLLCRIVLK